MPDHDRRPARPVRAQPTPDSAAQVQPVPATPAISSPVEANTPKPLGHYLKSLGFLTGPQLAQVLAQQAQRSAARAPISLGALLIAQGTMTPQDLVMALMIQQLDRVQAGVVQPTARIGELLLQEGLITAAQCASALYTQITHERPGMRLRLGQILIAQGLVTPRSLATVLRVQQEAWDHAHALARPSYHS
jgi:hypothetical protein